MTPTDIAIACAVGFGAAIGGVFAGGNSLLTVPTLMLLGMAPAAAVATNMVGIAALSLGASIRFAAARAIPRHPTSLLAVLAIPGSVVGAMFAVSVSERVLQAIIAVAMVLVVAFLLANPSLGATEQPASRRRKSAGYALSTGWAIYGGLFSGGYTTLLTFGTVWLFRTSLQGAVALTKVVNLVSSATATVVFVLAGVVDGTVVVPYAVAMFLGGVAGAHIASRVSATHLRLVFIAVVLALAMAVGAKAILAW